MNQQIRQDRISLQETGTTYSNGIANTLTGVPSFWKIYERNVELLSRDVHYAQVLSSLESGTRIITDHQTLSNYLACYAGLHYHKLQTSFDVLFPQLPVNATVDIIDYGCGQALATTVFYDYIIRKGKNIKVDKVILVEPSDLALKRGILHLNYFIDHKQQDTIVKKKNLYLDNVSNPDIESNSANIKIHLLSNILDVVGFDISALTRKINSTQKGMNFFICVSPFNSTSKDRIENFQRDFNSTSIYCPSSTFNAKAFVIKNNQWEDECKISMFQRIFKCNFESHIRRQNPVDDLPF